MLTKTTHVFASHGGLDLECDVYSAPHYAADAPVFLFFHSGGLVGGSKERVPSWLVQVRPSPSLLSSPALFLVVLTPELYNKGMLLEEMALNQRRV